MSGERRGDIQNDSTQVPADKAVDESCLIARFCVACYKVVGDSERRERRECWGAMRSYIHHAYCDSNLRERYAGDKIPFLVIVVHVCVHARLCVSLSALPRLVCKVGEGAIFCPSPTSRLPPAGPSASSSPHPCHSITPSPSPSLDDKLTHGNCDGDRGFFFP